MSRVAGYCALQELNRARMLAMTTIESKVRRKAKVPAQGKARIDRRLRTVAKQARLATSAMF
jgi:hypothetical protein